MSEAIEGLPVERVVGRLAAGWKLRALTLEQAGVSLASQCLRECAEELEAAMQQREPKRTSWFASNDGETPITEVQAARSVEPGMQGRGGE